MKYSVEPEHKSSFSFMIPFASVGTAMRKLRNQRDSNNKNSYKLLTMVERSDLKVFDSYQHVSQQFKDLV